MPVMYTAPTINSAVLLEKHVLSTETGILNATMLVQEPTLPPFPILLPPPVPSFLPHRPVQFLLPSQELETEMETVIRR